MCRWEVLEAATGAPVLFAASLPANTSGPQVRTYTCFAHCFAHCLASAVKQLAHYIANMPFKIAFAKLRSSFCAGVISLLNANHVTLSLHTSIAVCVELLLTMF